MKPGYKQQSAHKMSLATNLSLKASDSEMFDFTIDEENICISWWYRNQVDARDKIFSKDPGQWRIEGSIACKERRERKYSFPAKFLDNCTR
jgi:hypothetical protein